MIGLTPDLAIAILVNLIGIAASFVGLRVAFEHRLTKLETHMDMLIRGIRPARRRQDGEA